MAQRSVTNENRSAYAGHLLMEAARTREVRLIDLTFIELNLPTISPTTKESKRSSLAIRRTILVDLVVKDAAGGLL